MRSLEGQPEIPATPAGLNESIEREAYIPKLVGIFTSPKMGAAMEAHISMRAISGVGLEGDRYAKRMGAYSAERIGKPGRIPDEDRQVSLISTEGIEQANRELDAQGIKPFSDAETRRNLIVDLGNDDLNNLVGQRFMVGSVEMEGAELCTPCTRPPTVLKRKEDGKSFEEAFNNRGGLRAKIISGGEIRTSDKIVIL